MGCVHHVAIRAEWHGETFGKIPRMKVAHSFWLKIGPHELIIIL